MTSVTDIIRNAASGYGVDPAALQAIARIESNNNPDASNPSGAAGLFQFMPGTAQQYGLDNPYDAESSADAAARLARDNGAALERRLGREPTAGELYLAHQQGLGGASALLGNPDTSAVDVLEGVYGSRNRAEHAITQNGGNLGMTASQFANRWIEPANQYYNSYAGQTPAGGGAFDPTGGIVPGVPQPNLPAPAPLTAPSQGGGFNLGSMLSGGLNFLGGQAQQLGGQIGNVASKVPLPSQQQVVQAIMASPSARGAIIDPMIASLFTDKRGTIATNPNKYGSTPQERQYNAARREALANGGPLPSQGVTAVATALSTRPPVAAQQGGGGGGGGGGGNGGGAGGGGGTITGSATGRTYNVGQVYSNGNGSYMATENGFKRL